MLGDILAHCLTVIGDRSMTLTGLFLAGFAGSWTHCAGMCSPFVLSQTGARLASIPLSQASSLRRLEAAFLLPYHLGRITTYSVLAAILSVPVAFGFAHGAMWWLPPLMLMVAALCFIGVALGLLRGGAATTDFYQWFGIKLSRLGRTLASRPVGLRGYGLGLLLGLLPCGLVYAALAGAVSTADPVASFLGMAAFGVGTVPALIAVGYGGSWFLGRIGLDPRRVAPFLALGNAAFLLAVAFHMALRA